MILKKILEGSSIVSPLGGRPVGCLPPYCPRVHPVLQGRWDFVFWPARPPSVVLGDGLRSQEIVGQSSFLLLCALCPVGGRAPVRSLAFSLRPSARVSSPGVREHNCQEGVCRVVLYCVFYGMKIQASNMRLRGLYCFPQLRNWASSFVFWYCIRSLVSELYFKHFW